MENDLILEIDNVGPISHAKIDIGKINVVGGINSSGKSTASKLLYCFLRANSQSAEQLTIERGARIFRMISSRFRRFGRNFEPEDEEKLREIYNYFFRYRYSSEELVVEDFIDFYDTIHWLYEKYFLYDQNIRFRGFQELINTMDDYIENIMTNTDYIYECALIQLLDSEFNIRGPTNFGGIASLSSSINDFEDKISFTDNKKYHKNNYFIEDIYYLDSFSIFDEEAEGLSNVIHVNSLKKSLNENFSFIPGVNDMNQDTIEKIGSYINSLIKGEIVNINPRENKFKSKNVESFMKNTASGIKQIGVVQKLVKNNKLIPGNFFIIDEPEVNLHPAWQVKFAEILILLVKYLEISLYLNTHSPIFIEAIRTFADKYDLLEETNFYLTKEIKENNEDVSNKFIFDKVIPDNLYIIYEELGKPYDDLDRVQIKNMFKDRHKNDFSNIMG